MRLLILQFFLLTLHILFKAHLPLASCLGLPTLILSLTTTEIHLYLENCLPHSPDMVRSVTRNHSSFLMLRVTNIYASSRGAAGLALETANASTSTKVTMPRCTSRKHLAPISSGKHPYLPFEGSGSSQKTSTSPDGPTRSNIESQTLL